MKKCVVVGAGEFVEKDYHMFLEHENRKEILLIAADGGMSYLQNQSQEPDYVIGDFDSILPTDRVNLDLPKWDERKIILPEQKDETDMLAAIRLGMEKGCMEFHIFGGMGGRFDHTLANIQCMDYIVSLGGRACMYGNGQRVVVIQNGRLLFSKENQGMISIFALSDVAVGVTLEGLKYPLHEYTLTKKYPIGISNSFLGMESVVSVREGSLLICYEYIGGET